MIHIVIGAQFGDEGKGRVVDALSAPGSLVVRFNGGAQAGHTVFGPDGKPFVFSHIGAGTFQGAMTHLSQYFISNPILFREEHEKLRDLGITPYVSVAPASLITTPFDMLLNRAAEDARGDNRHGSCGLGINETVTRTDTVSIFASDLYKGRRLLKQLRDIQHVYVPQRALELGVPVPPLATTDVIIDRFLQDVAYFIANVSLILDDESLNYEAKDDIVFEGAQGLRLDELYGQFPHVTRSRTGCINPFLLLMAADRHKEPATVHYVTRTYTTRHGAGPLTGETKGHPFGWLGYETNVTNAYQGSFRYAPLNMDELAASLDRDGYSGDWQKKLAVTCLDQHPDPVRLLFELPEHTGLNIGLTSWGVERHANA